MTCLSRPNTLTAMNDNTSTFDVAANGRPGRFFYGWWILVVCSLLAIFGGSVAQSQSFLVIPMRDDLGLTTRSTALIFTLAAAAGTVAGLLVGWMADRFGSRPLVIFGGLAAGLGSFLFFLSVAYWHFILIFAVVFAGATVGFSMTTLLSTVNRWFSRHRPVAMATLMTVFALGSAFLPLLVALGLATIDWRSIPLFLGIFLCVLTVFAWLVLRSRPEDLGLWPDGDVEPPSTPDFTVREAMRTGAFWILVLGGMVLNDAGDTTVEDMTPAMTFAMAVLAILLTFGMGIAAARIPPRKILSVGMLIGAAGHLVLLLLDSDVGTVVFLSAVAVVQGGSAVYWIMVGDYFGRSRYASLMGVLLLLRAVAALVPSVIAGLLEGFGNYDMSLVFYLLVYAAAGVALWFAGRPSLPQQALVHEGEPAT